MSLGGGTPPKRRAPRKKVQKQLSTYETTQCRKRTGNNAIPTPLLTPPQQQQPQPQPMMAAAAPAVHRPVMSGLISSSSSSWPDLGSSFEFNRPGTGSHISTWSTSHDHDTNTTTTGSPSHDGQVDDSRPSNSDDRHGYGHGVEDQIDKNNNKNNNKNYVESSLPNISTPTDTTTANAASVQMLTLALARALAIPMSVPQQTTIGDEGVASAVTDGTWHFHGCNFYLGRVPVGGISLGARDKEGLHKHEQHEQHVKSYNMKDDDKDVDADTAGDVEADNDGDASAGVPF